MERPFSRRVFMIQIYDEPLMMAFRVTAAPLLASARKPSPRSPQFPPPPHHHTTTTSTPCAILWSRGISATAICQSPTAYDSAMGMTLTSRVRLKRLRSMQTGFPCDEGHKILQSSDPEQQNRNTNAIVAIFGAAAPQI